MDGQAIAVVALGLLAYALVSRRLESTILTPPMIFTLFGFLIGGHVLGWASLDFGHGFIHGLAEVTLILVLFSDAARIDLGLLRRDHDLPQRMLLLGLPLTIALGTAVALALPLGLALWEAALLAAILAPTDAALGQSVVSSPLVPARIRQALNVESGLNDGIALPVVLFFGCLASAAHDAGGDQNWILFGAMQVILGPLAGILIGGLGARLIDRAVEGGKMSESFQGPAILGVALLSYAASELIGGNGFIAAFVAGLMFGNQVRGRCGFIFEFAESEGQLLTLVTFLIFGAAVLPEALGHLDWAIVLYGVLSLTVLRMVPVAFSLLGAGLRWPTIGFLAWFGPRGLASMLFALLVLEEVMSPGVETILVTTIVTVALSILAHGVTAAPAARWYGKLAERLGTCEEKKPVSELPTRGGMVAEKNDAIGS